MNHQKSHNTFPRSSGVPQKNHRPQHTQRIQRIYVKVNSDFDATGMVTPRSITWTDGRIFPIETVTDFCPVTSMQSGRPGDCYTVIIHGEQKYLFFQRSHLVGNHCLGRWWVEVPES